MSTSADGVTWYVPTVVALGAVVLTAYVVEPVPRNVYVAVDTDSPATRPDVVTAKVGDAASVRREIEVAVTVRARCVISPFTVTLLIE